jgi:hypothetical protein
MDYPLQPKQSMDISADPCETGDEKASTYSSANAEND